MENYNLFDIVALTKDIDNLKKGTIGTIVEIWETNKLYEIEFIDEDGSTIALLTLNADEFTHLK